MAQRLLLEGTDIDALLERVRTEHGPEARIVHAEQKLVGGVGGFFARRRYEVAVALDDAAPLASAMPADDVAPRPTARPAAVVSPRSLEDLLSAADDLDGGSAPGGSAPGGAAPGGSAPGGSAPEDSAPDDSGLDSALDAGERGPGRQLSTELDSFDHLLRDLVARTEPGHHGPRSAPVPFFPPHPVPVTSPVPAVEGELPVFVPSVPPVMTSAPTELPEALAAFLAQGPAASAADAAPTMLRPYPVTGDMTAEPVAPDLLLEDDRPAYAGRHSAPVDEPPALPSKVLPSSVLPSSVLPSSVLAGPATHRSTAVPPSVLALGLPVEAAEAAPVDERTALLDVLAEVAVAAPARLTGTTVVVGDARHGLEVARQLLARTGTPSDAVVVAADHAPSELPAEADARARRHGAVVVVVDAGPDRAQAGAAGRQVALLGGPLGAATVVAVVDATRDADVVRSWLRSLRDGGAAADSLAAHSVEESPAPLRLLALGVPVAWLDARPATLGTWAAACLDRM